MNHITIGSDHPPARLWRMGLAGLPTCCPRRAEALLQRIVSEGNVMLDTAATYSGGKMKYW